MNYEEVKDHKKKLEDRVANASKAFKQFPKTDMGLIPDNVRKTDEYQKIKKEYSKAFFDLQAFNKKFVKVFKNEIRNERRNRFAKV